VGDARRLEELVAEAPVNDNKVVGDFNGVLEAFAIAGVDPMTVLAASQCQFGTANIEALVDDDTLGFVHPDGILCTAGKRKLFNKAVKYSTVQFAQCQAFAPCDYDDGEGQGKFGIEFGGPGNVLLGRIYWRWRAKRFRDSRQEIMAVAMERDRIQREVEALLAVRT
jgi:hypothetical protein